MHFTVEVERETDKRWIAEVIDLPGVMVYAATRKQAVQKAQALALRVLADRIEHGENIPAIAKHFVEAA
jgi:predicted RNase H-like HicB family nuclease